MATSARVVLPLLHRQECLAGMAFRAYESAGAPVMGADAIDTARGKPELKPAPRMNPQNRQSS